MINLNDMIAKFEACHINKAEGTCGQGNWQAMIRVNKGNIQWASAFGTTPEDALWKAYHEIEAEQEEDAFS